MALGEREGARRRLGVTAHGGGKVERWWQRGRTAAVWRDGGGTKGWRWRLEMDAGETERKERRRLEHDSYMTGGTRDFP